MGEWLLPFRTCPGLPEAPWQHLAGPRMVLLTGMSCLLFPGIHSTPHILPSGSSLPLHSGLRSNLPEMPPLLPPSLVAWPPSPRPRTAVPPRLGSSPPAAACPRCPPRRKSPRPGASMTVPGSSGAPAWTGPAQTWNPLTGWRGRPHRTPAPQRRWTTSPLSM